MNEELTEEKAEQMVREMMNRNANVQSFFSDVIQTKDTTKTGNLTIEELGMPRLTQRGVKELELFCRDIYDDNVWADYFKKVAEIQTSTSLSKDAILIKLVVTSKKELADTTPPETKKNKGMFGFGRDKGETK